MSSTSLSESDIEGTSREHLGHDPILLRNSKDDDISDWSEALSLPGTTSERPFSASSALSIVEMRKKRESQLFGLQRFATKVFDEPVHGYFLRSLEFSTGTLCPKFSAKRHVYVLLVPPECISLRVYATAFEGEVFVDKSSSAQEVQLIPNFHQQKVLVEIVKPGSASTSHEYFQDMDVMQRYLIDVRRSPEWNSLDEATRRPPSSKAETHLTLIGPYEQEHTRYIVMHPFSANSDQELDLKLDDLVIVRAKSSSGWWLGTVDGGSDKEGWFPSSHVTQTQYEDVDAFRTMLEDETLPTLGSLPRHRRTGSDDSSISRNAWPFQTEAIRRTSASPRTLGNHFPWFCIFSMTLQIILLIAGLSKEGGSTDMNSNPMVGASFSTLKDIGARWTPAIMRGHIYLLLTCNFVPVGVIRLIIDLLCHAAFCLPLEKLHGSSVTAIIYLLSGIGGHMTGSLFVPRWLGLGSGPSCMGCMTALCVIMFLNRNHQNFQYSFMIVCFVFVSILILSLFPGLDTWSHVGGVIFGGFSGIAVLPPLYESSRGKICQLSRLSIVSWIAFGIMFFVQIILIAATVNVDTPCEWCMLASCIPAYQWCNSTTRLGATAFDFGEI